MSVEPLQQLAGWVERARDVRAPVEVASSSGSSEPLERLRQLVIGEGERLGRRGEPLGRGRRGVALKVVAQESRVVERGAAASLEALDVLASALEGAPLSGASRAQVARELARIIAARGGDEELSRVLQIVVLDRR